MSHDQSADTGDEDVTRISDAVVHEVCSYLRKANEPGPCENCPAVIQTPYGPGTQACYALAHEAIEVVLRAYRKERICTTCKKPIIRHANICSCDSAEPERAAPKPQEGP